MTASIVLHLSDRAAGVFLVGYLCLVHLDHWLAKRTKRIAKDKVFSDEIEDWEEDPKDPEWESKGALTRARLTGKEQIIVFRVANLLRRLP